MTTLTEFLLARIAEDEAVARATLANFGLARDLEGPMLAHVAHFDPARVLAECEAKGQIVAMHGQLCFGNGDSAGDEVLELLAHPYADHPDFDETWRL